MRRPHWSEPSRSSRRGARCPTCGLRRGAPARTAKPKFRIEAANALISDVPPVRDRVALEQLATSRLAGMPPITGLYAFIAGSLVFALLGTSPRLSVGADSTTAPLFAAGIGVFAATGSTHYVDLVGILAVMTGAKIAKAMTPPR